MDAGEEHIGVQLQEKIDEQGSCVLSCDKGDKAWVSAISGETLGNLKMAELDRELGHGRVNMSMQDV